MNDNLFDWTTLLDSRAEFCLIFRLFLGQWNFKKIAFEIYWPLKESVIYYSWMHYVKAVQKLSKKNNLPNLVKLFTEYLRWWEETWYYSFEIVWFKINCGQTQWLPGIFWNQSISFKSVSAHNFRIFTRYGSNPKM